MTMKQRSNLTALWFIPLVAFIFASGITLAGVIGWKLLKPSISSDKVIQTTQATPQGSSHKVNPSQPKPIPPSQQTAALPPAKVRFENAFNQCLNLGLFPCSWEYTQDGVLKQFTIDKKDGLIVRSTYDIGGSPISQTIISSDGNVVLHRENKMIWYFDKDGLVRRISTAASSQSRGDEPPHTYFYTIEGQMNACTCADKTTQCCASAPNLQNQPRTYCTMFALDVEFCPAPNLK